MRRKRIVLILLATLSVSGVFGWIVVDSFSSTAPPPAQNKACSRGTNTEPVLINSEAAARDAGNSAVETDPTEANPEEPAAIDIPIPEGHWRLSGQLVNSFKLKYGELQNLDYSTLEVSLETYLPELEEQHFDVAVEVSKDGKFCVDVNRDELPNLNGHWRLEIGSSVEGILNYSRYDNFWRAENDAGEIDLSSVSNQLSPAVNDSQADFGKINIDLSWFIQSREATRGDIYGRLLHSSGSPIRNIDSIEIYAIPVDRNLEWYSDNQEELAHLTVDNEGYFYGTWYFANGYSIDCLTDPELQLHFCDETNWEQIWTIRGQTTVTNQCLASDVPKPTKGKYFWDFGTVIVGGSIVDIDIINNVPNLELESVPLTITSAGREQDYTIPMKGAAICLQHGLYSWTCGIDSFNLPLDVLADGDLVVGNELVVEQDSVVKLTITLETVPSIPITIRLPEDRTTLNSETKDVSVVCKNEDYQIEEYAEAGITTYIPTPAKKQVLTIGAKGFETVRHEFGPETEAIELTLKPVRGIKVTFILPALPEQLQGIKRSLRGASISLLHIPLVGTPTLPEEIDCELNDKPQVVENELEKFGRYYIVLEGLATWGYEDAILSELTLTFLVDTDNTVKFKPIPPPPWQFIMGGQINTVRVNDTDVKVKQAIVDEYRNETWVKPNRGFTDNEIWQEPQALHDGNTKIHPEITLPPKHGGALKVDYKLPLRIRVRVSDNGVHRMKFTATASFTDGKSDRVSTCGADVENGIANLWATAGEVTVSLGYADESVTKTVIVEAGRVVDVNFELTGCQVTTQAPDGQTYGRGFVVRLDKDGSAAHRIDLYDSKTYMMLPGQYLLCSVNGYNTKHFEIKADDRKLKLKMLKEVLETGELLIKLPARLPSVQQCRIYWTPKTGNPILDNDTNRNSYDLVARETQDGLLVSGVPIGRDICIVGEYSIYDTSESTSTYLLFPVVTSLTKSGESISSKFVKGVEAGQGWEHLLFCHSLVEGFPVVYQGYREPLFPGRNEYEFYAGPGKTVREWITVPADAKEFDLPDSIKKKLGIEVDD